MFAWSCIHDIMSIAEHLRKQIILELVDKVPADNGCGPVERQIVEKTENSKSNNSEAQA